MPVRKRKHKPEYFKRHTDYRELLRDEFEFACAYCEMRETELGGSTAFEIDHYKPQVRCKPQEITSYDNLMYSCGDCNRYKGKHWPDLVTLSIGHYILNPFKHDVDRHLNKQQPNWQDLTHAGKWNIQRLRLSSNARQRTRRTRELLRRTIIPGLQDQLQIAQTTLAAAEQRSNFAVINEQSANILELQESIDSCQKTLEGRMD